MNPIIARRAGAGALAAALAFPAGAAAHGGFDHGWHRHGKIVAGTVSSVDAAANQVTIKVASKRHSFRWNSFNGDLKLTVKRVKVADTNGDGQSTLADVAAGDMVIAKVRRLSIAQDGTATGTAVKLYDRGTKTVTLSRGDDENDDHGEVKRSDDDRHEHSDDDHERDDD